MPIVKAMPMSSGEPDGTRYCIVDADTGEILDDAQGYGYRSPQKAHAAWAYKNRDKSRDAEKRKKRKAIRDWMEQHGSFVMGMDQAAFEIAKGSRGEGERFDAAFVRQMLVDAGLDPPFTPGELLREWRR